MTTFLNLTKSLCRECGISGTGPISVQGQAGELLQVVEWVIQSYIEIQNRTQWRWLKRPFQFQTTASDGDYAYTDVTDTLEGAPIDRFTGWCLNDDDDPPKIYKTATGVSDQVWLTWLDLASFRSIHRIGTQTDQRPRHVAVNNQDALLLGPLPDDDYTVTGWYWRGPQVLATNDEVPEMPSQFHQLIVYYAMEHYAYKYVAQEHLERARVMGRRMLRNLEATQAPRICVAGPMI